MDDCIFCKIIKGEIPCYKIYEDEYVLAFLDVAEDYFGHTLVIPKKHFENLLDIDGDYLCHVVKAVQKISQHYKDDCNFKGINIINNNGDMAGQSVMHLHFHIIPKGDNKKCSLDEQRKMLSLN